jgi:hypothetical protein
LTWKVGADIVDAAVTDTDERSETTGWGFDAVEAVAVLGRYGGILDVGFGGGAPEDAFAFGDWEDTLLELRILELFDELFGSTPPLPAHSVHGQPMLLPPFSIRNAKCG